MGVMNNRWSHTAIACSFALLLGACSESHSQQVMGQQVTGQQVSADSAPASYPARVAMPSGPMPAPLPPRQPDNAVWQASGDSAQFAAPGAEPLLVLACEKDSAGAAWLRISRLVHAEAGASALFAVEGNARNVRLPLDVIRAGDAGEWRGLIPARDIRLDVFKGGNRMEATLPGGGTLKMPASSEPGRVIEACRAKDHPVAAEAA